MFLEYGGLLLSVLLLLGYHLFLYWKIRHNPFYAIQTVNKAARGSWVRYIMQDESHMLMGVQTLRNSTMVTTFLASTAVLLMMASLSLIGKADTVSEVWHVLNIAGPSQPTLWAIKVLALVSDFFVAFFSFAMAVRIYNHVGYQMNLPAEMQPEPSPEAYVVALMNRAGSYYTIGMRAYYFAVPLVFWLFGPLLVVVSTFILIPVLYINDKAPIVLPDSKK